jgi:hypothetical protein
MFIIIIYIYITTYTQILELLQLINVRMDIIYA